MKLAESVFDSAGRAVGKIVQDSESGLIDFLPRDNCPPIPGRPWRDLTELRDMLRKLYGNPLSPQSAVHDKLGIRQKP